MFSEELLYLGILKNILQLLQDELQVSAEREKYKNSVLTTQYILQNHELRYFFWKHCRPWPQFTETILNQNISEMAHLKEMSTPCRRWHLVYQFQVRLLANRKMEGKSSNWSVWNWFQVSSMACSHPQGFRNLGIFLGIFRRLLEP